MKYSIPLKGSSIDPNLILYFKDNGGFDAFYEWAKGIEFTGTKTEFKELWEHIVGVEPKKKTTVEE